METKRHVRSLVAVGDSSLVGIGDPLPDRTWRGAVPLLATALQADRVANLAFPGARLRCVRERQLSAALSHDPDLAVVLAGVNGTLRGEFAASQLIGHLDVVVGGLVQAGAQVILARLHDHTRLLPLPPVWRRVLQDRLAEVNDAVDVVAARHGALCLDLDALPVPLRGRPGGGRRGEGRSARPRRAGRDSGPAHGPATGAALRSLITSFVVHRGVGRA